MKELCKLNSKILNQDEISLTKLLLYGDSKYKNNVDKKDNISFHKFNTLYKAIWRPTDATFFLNIYLLGIFLSFYLCIFYALRFCIIPHYMDIVRKWGLVFSLWLYYFYFSFIIVDVSLYQCIFIYSVYKKGPASLLNILGS